MRTLRLGLIVLLLASCASGASETGPRSAPDTATISDVTSLPPDDSFEAPDASGALPEAPLPGEDAADTAAGLEVFDGLDAATDGPDVVEDLDEPQVAEVPAETPDVTDVTGAADSDVDAPSLAPFDCNAPSGPGEMVYQGDFVATSQADIDVLSDYSRIQGTLILSAGVASIALPNLKCVAGRLEADDEPTLESLSLPNLVAAGHDPAMSGLLAAVEVASNPKLTTLDLGALVSAPAGLQVLDDPQLVTLDLGSLERVDDVWGFGLVVAGNDALGALELPLLTNAAAFAVSSNDALEIVSAPLVDVGMYVELAGNSKLTSLTLPSLAGVLVDPYGNNWNYDALVVTGNAALESISLPLLVGTTRLTITENASLATLDLPALDSGCFATISNNPVLPQCQATAVGDGVTNWMLGQCDYMAWSGGSGLVSEANLGTCP